MSENQAAFSRESCEALTAAEVRGWYEDPVAVDYYGRASINLGLWESENVVFTRTFDRDDTLLDLGCGTGRIALGLWELGYRKLLGIDYSRPMIAEARRLSRLLDYAIAYRVGDATRLPLGDATCDGVIFGFNGLMQIPGRDKRRRALAEIRRVLVPGGKFVFTAHDRDAAVEVGFWQAERQRWESGNQSPRLIEFGDRIHETSQGPVFMHLATRTEVVEDLESADLSYVEDVARAHVANEPAVVRAFADDCRFWIAARPGGSR